jgi:hypothetical protein
VDCERQIVLLLRLIDHLFFLEQPEFPAPPADFFDLARLVLAAPDSPFQPLSPTETESAPAQARWAILFFSNVGVAHKQTHLGCEILNMWSAQTALHVPISLAFHLGYNAHHRSTIRVQIPHRLRKTPKLQAPGTKMVLKGFLVYRAVLEFVHSARQ